MRIDRPVMVMMVSFTFLMHFCLVFDQFHSFRKIKDNHIRILALQILHPSLFKPDFSDTEIGLTLTDLNHLLGRRIVCFRALSGRCHTINLEKVSGYLLCKIPLRLDGNGYRPCSSLFLPLAGRQAYDSQQQIYPTMYPLHK